MPFITASVIADGANTTRQWLRATTPLPALEKGQGLVFERSVVKIESFIATPVEVNTNTIYKLRCYSGQVNEELPFSDDRLIVDAMPGEQWSSIYYAFQRSGVWEQELLRDKPVVSDQLTMSMEFQKASGTYLLRAYLRLYYKQVSLNRQEWLTSFGR